MTTIVIGIDCGLTGGIAMLKESGLVATAEMPIAMKGAGTGKVKNEVNGAALAMLLRDWINGQGDEVMVVVEQVSSMPEQGVASVMSLGDTRGCIRGVIAAKGYPMHWVTPQRWKKHFGLQADKELARAKAIQLYPEAPLGRKKDHNLAEAILIARYGWEVLR